MVMPVYFEYGCPVRIVAGHDALEKIPDLLSRIGVRRPLIITDKGVSGAGLIDIMTAALQDRVAVGGIEDDVPPDSSYKTVRRIAEACRRKGCDALIAVGGGSVLDTAKGVN
nr:iron-containing alcohol dehydrogenase [Desulfobacterales bacterium]